MAKCKSTPFSATGQVAAGSEVVYHGFIVTTATATATILIRKANASGQIVDAIAASSAIGTSRYYDAGISCEGGLFFDLNGGTGTVNVLYES